MYGIRNQLSSLKSSAMLKNTILILVLGSVCALDLPPEFQKCKRSDPKIEECLVKAIEHALPIVANPLPEFNFEGIDPIKIPSLFIGEGSGAVHVTQNYKNVEIHNIQNSKILSARYTVNDNDFKLLLNASLDLAKLEGQYSLHGNILVFPITGNGTCTITLYNIMITLDLFGDTVTKKEEKYGSITDFKVKLVPERVTFDFRNLFNGNEVLGLEMNKLLNENWKEVFEDVIHKYEEVLGTTFKRLTNVFFKKVPFNQIFLP